MGLPPILKNSKNTLEGSFPYRDWLSKTYRSHRNAAAVIMKMAFGYTVTENDPFIKITEDTVKISGLAMAPGRWLVDYLPISKLFVSITMSRPLMQSYQCVIFLHSSLVRDGNVKERSGENN